MQRFFLATIVTILAISLNAQQAGTFNDPRDGKTYKTTKIGNQTWMAENLAHKPNSGNYWAYDNNQNNVAKYGYLYDWQTAKNVCPSGWHLPSDAEWTQLTNFVGSNHALKLKAKSGWSENGNGSDNFGFSALAGGQRASFGIFEDAHGYHGYWWCANEKNERFGWYVNMGSMSNDVFKGSFFKDLGISVRCLKN
jgi:uncharacterized protein (TIGR02145 family)